MDEKSESQRSGGPARQVSADVEDRPRKKMPVPVWFFVGIIFIIYGVIIVITGISEISHPPPTVLARTHPAIWWGAVITVLGVIFFYTTHPWKSRR